MAPKITHKNNTMSTETKKTKTAHILRDLAEKNGGEITPEIVLQEAKRKNSPLHPFFCWDNTKAAEEYRLIQAASLIRRIKITIPSSDETSIKVRAFINVCPQAEAEETPEEQARGVYVSFQHATTVESYREQMIANCKRDVEAFRRKYSALQEAGRIIKAMDHFEAEFSID